MFTNESLTSVEASQKDDAWEEEQCCWVGHRRHGGVVEIDRGNHNRVNVERFTLTGDLQDWWVGNFGSTKERCMLKSSSLNGVLALRGQRG